MSWQRAISLWQPWCFAITHLGKDVENRTWSTRHRGPVVLHAAKRRPTREECESFLDLAASIIGEDELLDQLAQVTKVQGRLIDALRALPRGGLVAIVDVVGCVTTSRSPWAFDGQYHWQLANARAVPFREVRGQRGFFPVVL